MVEAAPATDPGAVTLSLLLHRGPGATICPGEVARRHGWKSFDFEMVELTKG